MTIGYVWESVYGWMDPGTSGTGMSDPDEGMQPISHHVAHPDTKRRFYELLAVGGELDDMTRIRAVQATEEDILRVHERDHLDWVKNVSRHPKGGHAGDNFTQLGKGGYGIGTLAAGGVVQLTKSVVQGELSTGYAIVNPPGHHATRATGMGFCLFNNISVAAAYAAAELGVEKIAVVDWDVHHGNGTQDIWYDNPEVLTISIHQDRLFPLNQGLVSERGEGDGRGSALNIPLPPGCSDTSYAAAFEQVVMPALKSFNPDLILIASGLDASAQDPLGRQMVTTGGYRKLTELALGVAQETEAKIVFSQEGGYSPTYLPFCGRAIVREMLGKEFIEERIWRNAENWGRDTVAPHHQAAIDDAKAAWQSLS